MPENAPTPTRRVHAVLGAWNDFRNADRLDILQYPEVIYQQTNQILYLIPIKYFQPAFQLELHADKNH